LLKIGSVIRLKVTDTNPPKTKWFVIVGQAGDQYAIVYINTGLRWVPPDLQGSQLPIIEKDCPFLDHDSHIDCGDLREKPAKKIDSLHKEDPSIFKGILPAPQLRAVQELIKKAKSIAPALKKKYGLVF
jgi:hypothetical protein